MSVLCVILYVVLFATGPGSIPWFLVSELFNQSARPAATSVAIAVNWTANFIVSIGFLPLKNALGAYVFVIFAMLQAGFTFFIWKKVPETKNKTIEEISSMFRQRSYQWGWYATGGLEVFKEWKDIKKIIIMFAAAAGKAGFFFMLHVLHMNVKKVTMNSVCNVNNVHKSGNIFVSYCYTLCNSGWPLKHSHVGGLKEAR